MLHANYGSTLQMGQPPEKKSGNISGRSIIVSILAFILAVVITAILTWYITKTTLTGVENSTNVEETKNEKNSAESASAADLKLPETVIPLDYQLTVKTYLPGYGWKSQNNPAKNLTLEGQLIVKLNVTQKLRKITMSSLDLEYNSKKSSLSIGEDPEKTIDIESIDVNKNFEKVFINLKEAIEAGTIVKLKLVYTGPLRNDMTGFYQTVYSTDDGQQKMSAVTQMEPVYARRMVPCFDEPAFKAPWTVTVIHPKGTTALSNGKEKENSTVSEEFVSTSFIPTPKMSSYLLAIFVSDFEYNESQTKTGVRFRVWSRPEAKKSTEYALKAGVKCLEYYDKYYDLPFPLEKQDMVAIPDFSAGAMENWGLITYRENDLLYDPKINTGLNKERVASVIAHELAHQWFGNLVTMKWWNDLWLNEGFATIVQYLGTDEISDGNFKMDQEFLNDDLSSALDADSIASTHPMTFKIDKGFEVLDSFDTITYSKGGSVLWMLRKTLGEENFNNGINAYLKKYSYSNAEAVDLFKSLTENLPNGITNSEGGQLNVTEFAEPWTSQLGYPMISVDKVNSTHIKLSQERFKKLKDAKEQEKYSHPKWGFKWDVPIWYQDLNGGKIEMKWLKSSEDLYIESDKTLVFNANSDGFYRVNYTEQMWNEISDVLLKKHDVFSVRTRVRLVSDAFANSYSGGMTYEIPIKLIEYLKNEQEYEVWQTAIQELRAIVTMYGTDPEKEPIEKFMTKLISKSPAYKDINYVVKHYTDEKLFFEVNAAQLLISSECTLNDAGCIGNMTKLFHDDVIAKCDSKKMLSHCSTVPAPFRGLSYCQGVRNGNDEIFEKVIGWYNIERNQAEKRKILNALACSKDVVQLKKLLLDSMKKEGSMFRLQDVSSLFAFVSKSSVAQDSMFDFLLTRWDEMQVRLAEDRSGFNGVLKYLTNNIRNEQGLEQLKNFEKKTKNWDFRKIEESIAVVINWRNKNAKKVSELFENAIKNI
ncbi:unnamed protein product [Caenorhabditis angaria]|uniref:Aminopeptidase n=1 Tax=Caenorhabditis angaria TaxID=860376 RepID=A0A9P1IRW9_9PELO|nr:unnamed protein product [Caenorhabditis angaria]